jgi:DUF971 family protein
MLAPELTISASGEALVLKSDGGGRSIGVETLWSECRSAAARRRRIEGTHLPAPLGLRITEANVVGHYGLHIVFSADARGGVFPWPMLIELSRRPQIADYIIS